eukprot:11410731-Ditylum_brightwellii.AAC.1
MQPLAIVCLLIGVDDEQGPQSSRWIVQGITCPFYVAASRAKEQEVVNFLEKKVDGMKGCDLDLTVATTIMCLGTVLG